MTNSVTPDLKLASGRSLPLLGLGTFELRSHDGYRAIREAIDVGYRHFDTATMYENEDIVGDAIRDSGIDRDEIFITTKVPQYEVGRAKEVLSESLEALHTPYVDLWLIHWPPDDMASPETWLRLVEAQERGEVRDIGVSNYSTSQIDELIASTGVTPAIDQIPWRPAFHDQDRLDELGARGVAVSGYSPFAGNDRQDPRVLRIARRLEATPEQVVLAWHLAHGIVVIPKSAQPDRMISNLAARELQLTAEDVSSIDSLSSLGAQRAG